ncbi:MAG: PASTA domain-containing protein [Acidimicrobiia bacterium]
MASTRIADHIGRVLGGRYRLAAAIGTGASAHVFLADDVRLGRRVAVKVLHPALADDAAFLKRFRAEARAAAALNHPNVMAVYDWGEEADGPFIVTEFLGGGSLRAMLDRGNRLTPSQVLLVGLMAARGLDYAHRRGLVHRDIKPANLLFDEEGRLRIADFGLARALAEAAWTEPSGAVLGTARYAAPEQVRGVPLDGKADVYALAVVLVEAATGRVPFAADTTVGTILSRLERPMDVPEMLGPMVPILSRAGQPDPTTRPDAMALGAALHALAGSLPAPEPLPLAGPAAFDEVEVVVDHDPTDMGILAPTPPVPATPPVAAMAPTVEVISPPAVAEDRTAALVLPAATEPVKPSKAGRRKRRWLRVTLATILALVCGTVGTVALVKAQVPSHQVPPVTDLDAAEAAQRLRTVGFSVTQRQEFNDDGKAEGVVVGQTPAPPAKLKEGKTVTLIVSKGPSPVSLPADLGSMTRAEAEAALESLGLKPSDTPEFEYSETVASGRLLDWDPKEGTRKGDTVTLTVSRGPQPRVLPDLTAMTYDQAAAALQDLGLNPVRDTRFDDEVANGKIIGTRPPVGNTVPRGETVTIVVSRGQPVVPNLDGKTEAEARAALEAAGLKLGSVFGLPGGKVFRSAPDTGAKLKVGTAVNIFVL